MPYEIVKHDGEYCIQKKSDGSTVKGSCHADRGETVKMLAAIEANEKYNADGLTFVVDQFVSVQPGEPFRILPFGTLVKNGQVHEITPEYAGRFKLPHFKPPVKLGSHEETTPAGGFIVGLEVRDDGLYAIPEWNPAGSKALLDGAFRYHSPEVLWDGYFENPTDGAPIEGPLIVGDALLHSPHLGEQAALYTAKTHPKGATMNETVEVPRSLWDRFVELFTAKPPVTQELQELKVGGPTPEELVAVAKERDTLKAERDDYKAKIEAFEAAEKAKAVTAGLVTELMSKTGEKQVYGATFIELRSAETAAGMLASMDETQRAWVLGQFKAMAAQIEESKLTGEIGGEGAGLPAGAGAAAEFDAAVKRHMADKSVDYMTALRQVAELQPELYQSYRAGPKKE